MSGHKCVEDIMIERLREFTDNLEKELANPSGVSSEATRCSHGGENALANAARSHDSAFDDLVKTLLHSKRICWSKSDDSEAKGESANASYFEGKGDGFATAANMLREVIETAVQRRSEAEED